MKAGIVMSSRRESVGFIAAKASAKPVVMALLGYADLPT